MCYLYFRLRKKMTEFNFSFIKYYPITFKPDCYYLWTMRYSPDMVYNLSICESQNDLRSWINRCSSGLVIKGIYWIRWWPEPMGPALNTKCQVPVGRGRCLRKETLSPEWPGVKTRAGPGEHRRGARPRLSTIMVTFPHSPTHNTKGCQCQGLACHGICWLRAWTLLPLQRET